MKTARLFLLVASLISFAAPARSVDIKTSDGLSLRLADKTGFIEVVTANGSCVPLLPPVHPISVREFTPNAKVKNLVPNPGFEGGDATPASWTGSGATTARVAELNHTPSGRFCGKVSAPAGASESHPATSGSLRCVNFPAKPNTLYLFHAWGRVPRGSSGGNVFVIELDAKGRVLTENKFNVQHSLGWAREPRDQWTRLDRTFITKPGCAQVHIYANIWKGYGAFYFDDVEVFDAASFWKDIALSPAPLTPCDGGKSWCQRLSAEQDHLDVELRYTALKDHVRIETTVQDTHEPRRERAVRLSYTLPVNAAGWTWHDDGRRSRVITANGTACDNSLAIGGGRVSAYPFTSITRDANGLSLGAPMDCPRLQNFTCDAAHGYGTMVDLGLSPLTKRIGAGKATFTTILFAHDGEWGLRAAASRFYTIFPDHFAKRSKRDGMWLYAVPVRPIANPEDFGFAFYEGWFPKAEDRAHLREKGIYLLPYTEPWGARQVFAQARTREEMPPYEERLAQLKQWAGDKQSNAKLMRGPRWEVAQAILNSMPFDKEGRGYFRVDKYSTWAQWWMTNPNPQLPEPNRAISCRRYEIEPFLANADGIYLDSVSSWLAKDLNFRVDHLDCARIPPIFDGMSGRPALLGLLSWCEFMDWLASDLHSAGKLVHMNIFPDSYRFCAHLADVLGSEVGWSRRKRSLADVETDSTSLLRRMLAFQKPTTNLLQEGDFTTPQPEQPASEIEAYVKHQMFYGFFPGIATIGGEDKPGYKGWKRYFSTPSQYERDRPVFKKLIPIIQTLCAAGWEPVTFARTSRDDVFVERFGSWARNNLFFTLRNNSEKEQLCNISVQAADLGMKPGQLQKLAVHELVSGTVVAAKVDAKASVVELAISLRAKDTAVLKLEQ
ncbi:MAG: hypothetical protein WA117_25520 [Verrucomicrobiia bacterium]